MIKKLMLAAAFVVGVGGVVALPSQSVGAILDDRIPQESVDLEQGNTCKDLEGFNTNHEGNSSGVWGSIEFEDDNGPLVLTVEDGYTVILCVKKGSAIQGQGPVELDPFAGPQQDVEVNYPDAKDPEEGFSHYAFKFFETPDDDNGDDDNGEPVVPTNGDEDEDEEEQPKEEADDEVQVQAPTGVDAGAGPAAGSAVLGMFSSLTAVVGVATRKLSAILQG